MRVRVFTLAFAPSLGGFDEAPLLRFQADKEIVGVQEHFFLVHDVPYLFLVHDLYSPWVAQ